jgi:hypothetical protein
MTKLAINNLFPTFNSIFIVWVVGGLLGAVGQN